MIFLFVYRYLVPADPNIPYDMLSIVRKIVDENSIFEIMPTFAPNIICAFARLNGYTVGVSNIIQIKCII
jgi:propionyl-CoA carboxylase beta chain